MKIRQLIAATSFVLLLILLIGCGGSGSPYAQAIDKTTGSTGSTGSTSATGTTTTGTTGSGPSFTLELQNTVAGTEPGGPTINLIIKRVAGAAGKKVHQVAFTIEGLKPGAKYFWNPYGGSLDNANGANYPDVTFEMDRESEAVGTHTITIVGTGDDGTVLRLPVTYVCYHLPQISMSLTGPLSLYPGGTIEFEVKVSTLHGDLTGIKADLLYAGFPEGSEITLSPPNPSFIDGSATTMVTVKVPDTTTPGQFHIGFSASVAIPGAVAGAQYGNSLSVLPPPSG